MPDLELAPGPRAGRAPDVTYHGAPRLAHGCGILIENAAGELLGLVTHVVRHSPSGIGWGYGGSGPADCARSLLIDALGDQARCPSCNGTRWIAVDDDGHADIERPYDPDQDGPEPDPDRMYKCYACDDGWRPLPYQDFKFQVVARWPIDGEWTMSRAEVLAWLTANRKDTDTWHPDQGG